MMDNDDNDDLITPDGAILDLLKKAKEEQENSIELEIDRALARSMVAGIMSRAEGDKEHAKFLAVNAVLYTNAAAGIELEEFIDLLREGDEHTSIKVECVDTIKLGIKDEGVDSGDKDPQQNAPTSKKLQ